MKRQGFAARLGFALDGIRAAAAGEASFRLQLILGLGAAGAVLIAALAALVIGGLIVAIGLGWMKG